MITFFTDPYKDELIYSAVARYHHYIGNIDLKDTLEELFDTRTAIATVGIQCNLNTFVRKLGNGYSTDELISNNTIFPFYSPFIYKDRKKEVINTIKSDNGIGIYNRIGIVAGGICKKNGIYYCPLCAKKDIDEVGEPYIHREHQLEGVFLCPHHGEELKKYPESIDKSRVEFTRFDEDKIEFTSINNIKSEYYNILMKLSTGAYYLLKTNLGNIDKIKITQKYKECLFKRELAGVNGGIRQEKLYEEFIAFYGKDFLAFMESETDKDYEYNWLKVITRNSRRAVHPIRHLMLIYFLTQNIEKFFREFETEYMPFGEGPWFCLNKVCDNYKKRVVTDLKITADYKTREPVGTFTCQCGFVYSRKGPNKIEADQYKVGYIKEFGEVWKSKLKECFEKNFIQKQITEIMGCDVGTVRKYKDIISNNISMQKTAEIDSQRLEEYKRCILDHKNDYPLRTQLRSVYNKEYTFLYKYDKQWLFENLPPATKSLNIVKVVDWNARDIELLNRLENKYFEIISREVPTRICLSTFKRELQLKDSYIKHLDKMPKSKEYLNSKSETIEEFQIRRCKKIIDSKFENDEQIRLWEIQRLGGVKDKDLKKIKNILEKYTEMKLKKESAT